MCGDSSPLLALRGRLSHSSREANDLQSRHHHFFIMLRSHYGAANIDGPMDPSSSRLTCSPTRLQAPRLRRRDPPPAAAPPL